MAKKKKKNMNKKSTKVLAKKVAPKMKAKAKTKPAKKIAKTAKSTHTPLKPMQEKTILRQAPVLEKKADVVDLLDSTAENTTNDV